MLFINQIVYSYDPFKINWIIKYYQNGKFGKLKIENLIIQGNGKISIYFKNIKDMNIPHRYENFPFTKLKLPPPPRTKDEITKIYTIRLQRYRNEAIWVLVFSADDFSLLEPTIF